MSTTNNRAELRGLALRAVPQLVGATEVAEHAFCTALGLRVSPMPARALEDLGVPMRTGGPPSSALCCIGPLPTGEALACIDAEPGTDEWRRALLVAGVARLIFTKRGWGHHADSSSLYSDAYEIADALEAVVHIVTTDADRPRHTEFIALRDRMIAATLSRAGAAEA